MQDIIINTNKANLKLTFIDAFSPSELNIKADQWFFRYKLIFKDDSYSFKGSFTGKYWHSPENNIVIVEEYANKNFGPLSIKRASDIKRRLLLIDLNRNKLAKFSRLQVGRFDSFKLANNGKIIFIEKQYKKTKEVELCLNSLKYKKIKSQRFANYMKTLIHKVSLLFSSKSANTY